MQQSSAEAARILKEHGATACTDVTGFGLLGHLVEMTRPSQVFHFGLLRPHIMFCSVLECLMLSLLLPLDAGGGTATARANLIDTCSHAECCAAAKKHT